MMVPFLSHNGVDIFDCYKGDRAYRPWFGITANEQVDGSFFVFDVRYDASHLEDYLEEMMREDAGMREALRRAIEDDYDFVLACEGHYSQPWRRFRRWLGFPAAKKDASYL